MELEEIISECWKNIPITLYTALVITELRKKREKEINEIEKKYKTVRNLFMKRMFGSFKN